MARDTTVTEFIKTAYLLQSGKSTPPAASTPKYDKLLALGNYFQAIWANEPGTVWASLRDTFIIGTVTATDTFALDTDIGRVSNQPGDFVRIYHKDGVGETDYSIVNIERLYEGTTNRNTDANPYRCAVSGTNLVFSHTFITSDAQFGGSIRVPGYHFPDELVSGSDTIQVDDPNWLAQICAAEAVRTDLTRQAQYPNLIAAAQESMQSMKDRNSAQIEDVYNDGWSPNLPSTYDFV